MTNTIALCLGAAIVVAIGYDVTVHEGATLIFLGRKALDLIEWVAFWR